MSNKRNLKLPESSRSWFCEFMNPQNFFGDIEPLQMVNMACDMWCTSGTRSCGINYEISDSGTPHMHMVLEDTNKARKNSILKLFKGIHLDVTHGSKKEATDYLEKRGKWEEKNHTLVVPPVYRGDIKAHTKRQHKALEEIKQLIADGLTPNQIMSIDYSYIYFEKVIRKGCYLKRLNETPDIKEMKVYWHLGEADSGKSYIQVKLRQEFGRDNIFVLTDYLNGGFDNYMGEPILFMDEFKGMSFQVLLNVLDVYPNEVHCRYANTLMLWNEVHITSVYPPEEAYNLMVSNDVKNTDKQEQLFRRIHYIVFHYKKDGKRCSIEVPMNEYTNYSDLKQHYLGTCDFHKPAPDESIPFLQVNLN